MLYENEILVKEYNVGQQEAYNYMRQNKTVGALAFQIYDTKEEHLLFDSFKGEKGRNGEVFSYIGACHMLRKISRQDYLYPPNLMYGAEERYASFRYYDNGYHIEYFTQIKVIHSPSKKTRMSQIQTHRNVMINHYVIKKLVLPQPKKGVSALYFLLRQLKYEKINVKQIRNNYEEVKTRYKDNIEVASPIKLETLNYLSETYGKMTVL